MIRLKGGGYSDKGTVKTINEDAYIFRVKHIGDSAYGVFAVSDGISGLECGEVASSYIMSALDKWWHRNIGNKEEISVISENLISLEKCICETNDELIRYGKGQGNKCGATLSILFIYDNKGFIFHTGDSRIYCLSKKVIGYNFIQLTEDHTKHVAKNTQNGIIKKNYLTECIGAKENFLIFRTEIEISKNNVFLICSDGIYKSLTEGQIVKILSKKYSLSEICRHLVFNAIKNGETDNITAVAATISEIKNINE